MKLDLRGLYPGTGGRGEEKRVAVGCRSRDGLGGEIGARAGPVLDNELLPETLREPLRHQAGNESPAPPAANLTMMQTGRDG
jgi:hypothetical protein